MPTINAATKARALELYRLGATASEVAKMLGCSLATVKRLARAAGIRHLKGRRSNIDAAGERVVAAMYADGITIAEIMKETGASVGAVYRSVKQLRRTFTRSMGVRRLNDEHRKAVIAALAEGQTYAQIAKRHGVTKQAIGLIARKAGVARRQQGNP